MDYTFTGESSRFRITYELYKTTEATSPKNKNVKNRKSNKKC